MADGMLGKLTRWLRILGYDVAYSTTLSDRELVETAKAEGRVLLTCDLQLFQQASMHGTESFLIEGTTESEKLALLANRFDLKLEADAHISRCPMCNTRINVKPKDQVTGLVPEKTFSRYDEFWECPNCKKLYWQGSHWKKIYQTLQDAQNEEKAMKKQTLVGNE